MHPSTQSFFTSCIENVMVGEVPTFCKTSVSIYNKFMANSQFIRNPTLSIDTISLAKFIYVQWSRNREHILCRANYRCRGVYVKNIMLRASCLHIMSSTYDALANRGFTALFCKQVTLVTHRIGMWFTCSTIITVISIPMNRMLMICATSYYFFTCNNLDA